MNERKKVAFKTKLKNKATKKANIIHPNTDTGICVGRQGTKMKYRKKCELNVTKTTLNRQDAKKQ